ICLDESITSLERAEDMVTLGAGRIINIKPGRVGGFAPSRAIHALCARWSEAAYTDRKSTRLNSSHVSISYAVFCLKKKKTITKIGRRKNSRTTGAPRKPAPGPSQLVAVH